MSTVPCREQGCRVALLPHNTPQLHSGCTNFALWRSSIGPKNPVQGTVPLRNVLRERVGAQLARLSLAFARCALLFEGSPSFELALLSSAEELVWLGRRAGVAVAVLTSSSPAQTQVLSFGPLCMSYTTQG